jgi:CBS domain-containing protein
MIVEGIPGRVEDLMTRDPMVIDQDAPLVDAAQLMDTLEITGLPVIDGDGRLVGVLSQTDVLRAAATRHLWHAWPGLAVRHLMTSPAIAVRSDCTLDDAAHLMERERVHRLVVVGDDGETPIGILTLSDFVRMLAEAFDHA